MVARRRKLLLLCLILFSVACGTKSGAPGTGPRSRQLDLACLDRGADHQAPEGARCLDDQVLAAINAEPRDVLSVRARLFESLKSDYRIRGKELVFSDSVYATTASLTAGRTYFAEQDSALAQLKPSLKETARSLREDPFAGAGATRRAESEFAAFGSVLRILCAIPLADPRASGLRH